jgi:minor extracellular serine protease Vpr
MAPEADLIVVRSGESRPFSDSVLEGIAYIQAKAKELGRPSVINLSFGNHTGPHDGTSNYELAMDNASGPGQVIVASAGNEGLTPVHAKGTVSAGATKRINLNVPGGTPYAEVHLWYSGQESLGFRVIGPGSSCTTQFQSAPHADFILDSAVCGGIFIATPDINPNNGDKEVVLFLGDTDANLLPRGTWQLELKENSGVRSVSFDAYTNDNLIGPAPLYEQNLFTGSLVDFSGTIGSPGTATQVITAGSYVTKTRWQAMNGATWVIPSIMENTLSDFSSKGPRRSCTLCSGNALQKPDLVAPGEVVMSSASAQSSAEPGHLGPGGTYRIMAGTSMAAPHVVGAVALLLQAAPGLTAGEIKTLLTAHAKQDPFNGSAPNDSWGYGKLDVKAAFAATPNPLPGVPAGLSVTGAAGVMNLTWGAVGDLDVDGYHVYRSTASGTGFSKLTSSPVESNSFNDTDLIDGTTYFYQVSAVDSKGQEGALSAEKSAVMTVAPSASLSPSSGGGGGCVFTPGSEVDPVLAGLFLLALSVLGIKKLNSD